jgi:hypothetical protein
VIPFNLRALVGRELDNIAEAIASHHASSGGRFTEQVSRLLTHELGAADVPLTTSCTDALELSALLVGLGPGDVGSAICTTLSRCGHGPARYDSARSVATTFIPTVQTGSAFSLHTYALSRKCAESPRSLTAR